MENLELLKEFRERCEAYSPSNIDDHFDIIVNILSGMGLNYIIEDNNCEELKEELFNIVVELHPELEL